MQNEIRSERLLTTREAAAILCCSEKTMANWRYLGKGPEWVDVEGRPKYQPSVLRTYIHERQTKSTAQARVKRRVREINEQTTLQTVGVENDKH
jgi:hypothetical protein